MTRFIRGPEERHTYTMTRSNPAGGENSLKKTYSSTIVGLSCDWLCRPVYEETEMKFDSEEHIKSFLDDVQSQKKESSHLEPVLCSDPIGEGLDLRFPVLIVQVTPYSREGSIFMAENDAAVSASCALKMQKSLDDVLRLTKRSSAENDHDFKLYKKKVHPMVFSICSQGPLIELWVHYLEDVGHELRSHARILATCRATIRSEVKQWLDKVDSIILWAGNTYAWSVIGRLVEVMDGIKGEP